MKCFLAAIRRLHAADSLHRTTTAPRPPDLQPLLPVHGAPPKAVATRDIHPPTTKEGPQR
ncbi:hypothetical protein MA6G0728S_5325 [Mycobacteroides abscessus 6G-0728-S]|nr:hypothetical protein MA6G0728S_5325 [Mycobacteroides abscessus 6G-0728-S]